MTISSISEPCWIMCAMISLMVSMLSRSCSVSNRFLNWSWNSNFFDPICVVSTLGGLLVIICFISISTSSLMLLITIPWSPMLTWLMTVTSVTMSRLFVRINHGPNGRQIQYLRILINTAYRAIIVVCECML